MRAHGCADASCVAGTVGMVVKDGTMKILFNKMDIKTAISKGYQQVAVPVYEKDYANFNKIKGDMMCQVSKIRSPKQHRLFFVMCEIAVDQGILDRHLQAEIDGGVLEISSITISKLQFKYKDDIEVLRYILKWLFLPLDTSINPVTGEAHEQVSSMAFEPLDQVAFQAFFDKAKQWIAAMLGTTEQALEQELMAVAKLSEVT
jgi:hypothetical protein